MSARMHKALLAFVFVLSFILNGSAMQVAHAQKAVPMAMEMTSGEMPCDHAGAVQKHHPCCPKQMAGLVPILWSTARARR